MVRIDRSGAKEFLPEGSLVQQAQSAIDMLKNGTGAGSDFIGWVDLPVNYDKEEFSRIQKAAKKIQSDSRALVVIGIGGSYLGARAVIELLRSPNYNMLQKSTPDIYFAGNGISSDALSEIIAMIGNRDFSVNVISKSGTTTEPAIAFRIFKEMLEKKYGKEGARERIYATTDKAKGALKTLATKEGYETFVVPDNVGGRYSVLTAVGLLPIAVSGIDIEKLMQGAAEQREEALVGLGVVAAQPPDRKRVDHERLRKAPVGQVGPHPRKTRLVHPAPLVRSCGQCSRRGMMRGTGASRHPVVNIPGGMVLS